MVTFTLGGMVFEYDEEKNQKNIKKHGISFKSAARVFFDYDRIELLDEGHSSDEIRYDTIGDISFGRIAGDDAASPVSSTTIIGNINQFIGKTNDILYVVYTERLGLTGAGTTTDVTRLISARLATSFERGLYYGKYD